MLATKKLQPNKVHTLKPPAPLPPSFTFENLKRVGQVTTRLMTKAAKD
jgi:hypothetical protein